jgi:hypothetical protein
MTAHLRPNGLEEYVPVYRALIAGDLSCLHARIMTIAPVASVVQHD